MSQLISIARDLTNKRLLQIVYTLVAWGMAMNLLVMGIVFAAEGLFSLLDDQTIKLLLTPWR